MNDARRSRAKFVIFQVDRGIIRLSASELAEPLT